MNSFFGNAESFEHSYKVDGDVEQEEVVNESVEVPDEVPADVEPAKPAHKGRSAGGSDYVYRGDF